MISILLMSNLFLAVVALDLMPYQVLRELNFAFQTELNVLVDIEDSFVVQDSSTPKIQLSSKSSESLNLRLRGNFTSQALIIVQLMDFGLEPKVADFLPLLLDRLNELHIVFLTKKDPEFLQKQLYTYCYKEGFINVILLHDDRLYSYLPYPSIQPIKLANVSEYLKRGKTIRNFKGFPVRIIRSRIPPRDFEYYNDRNELVRRGYLFAAANEFIERYNASLKSVSISEEPKSDYEGYLVVIRMSLQKEVDLICYYKDLQLEWDIPYTEPLSILTSYFIVPHARPISSYLYYSRPFRWSLWLVVAFTVFYGALMLYLGSGRDHTEIGKCLLYSLSHILNTCNQAIRTAGWRDHLIHVILTLGGFMLTNLYLATLSSILTSGLSEPQYKTIEDLADAPYPSVHDELFLKQVRENTFLPEALRLKAVTINVTLMKAYRENLNSSYIYLSFEDRLELSLMQQDLLKTPRFDVIRQGVTYSLEGFYVSRSLPYLGLVSEFMFRLQEHGINMKMKKDTFWVMIKQKMYTLMRDEEPPAKAFDLQFYYFAFALWFVGLAISLLIFFVEIYYSRFSG
ncbi:uncharacterized protein LOC110179044 [Drosophila serrata]|uniref:uncharacterized protein LOC110179044 n=1 Tax=Drosophila serrata TaxID=7274 RepID=UPI000A1D2D27|nr:uncharacterized protein LOC110179044 [Drosophila serrata]